MLEGKAAGGGGDIRPLAMLAPARTLLFADRLRGRNLKLAEVAIGVAARDELARLRTSLPRPDAGQCAADAAVLNPSVLADLKR